MSPTYDLVVLGGGTGGLVSALIAAGVGARVALIERDRTGGDCLWTGCVPSKSLLAAAGLAHRMRSADAVGLGPVEPVVDFARVMAHVRDSIAAIEPEDSPARLRAAGVDVLEGEGRFTGPGRIEVDGRGLGFRAAIVATGSEPSLPTLPGLAATAPLTSDSVWDLDRLPGRLVVLGGGPVGCELGQAFARLGSAVTIVEQAPRLLAEEEPEASDMVARRLAGEGIEVRLDTAPRTVEDRALLLVDGSRLPFDRLLLAAGRRPRSADIGLESVGATVEADGAVAVDERLRTTARGIYAVGDVTGLLPFTHVAAHHARVATPNALFHRRAKVARALPWATFTDPEVGRVGLTEAEARGRWGRDAIAVQSAHPPDRAITAGKPGGLVKLVADPRGRLVGATVVGPAAGESIGALAVQVAARAKLGEVSEAVKPYPTYGEAPARAADSYLLSRRSRPGLPALSRGALAALRMLDRPGRASAQSD